MKSKTDPDKAIFTAKEFEKQLQSIQTKADFEKNQRFYRYIGNNKSKFIGVRMASLFAAAKKFEPMPINEIEKLLNSSYYESRMGAICIMDFQARNKKQTPERKKELYELYLKKHDCINNWDLIDRGAPHIIGGYLIDKPRKILYKLAKSKNLWERRTAIVSTWFFIRQGEIDDTFAIAEILVKDDHDLIHTAAGSWLREAGKRDRKKLVAFLDKHAKKMPRVMLRFAVEKLDKELKDHYMGKSPQKQPEQSE